MLLGMSVLQDFRPALNVGTGTAVKFPPLEKALRQRDAMLGWEGVAENTRMETPEGLRAAPPAPPSNLGQSTFPSGVLFSLIIEKLGFLNCRHGPLATWEMLLVLDGHWFQITVNHSEKVMPDSRSSRKRIWTSPLG